MANQCTHIRTNGARCGSSAMRAVDQDGMWRCLSHSHSQTAKTIRATAAEAGRRLGGAPRADGSPPRTRKYLPQSYAHGVVPEAPDTVISANTDLGTAEGLLEATSAAIRAVARGRDGALDPARASAFASLARLALELQVRTGRTSAQDKMGVLRDLLLGED